MGIEYELARRFSVRRLLFSYDDWISKAEACHVKSVGRSER